MPLKNYATEDEEDFYGQNFEVEGFVSIWLGQTIAENDTEELDVLQDLCGVGYYDPDNQEGNCFEFKLVQIRKLLEEISFSESFLTHALEVANRNSINTARWVTVQFDFAYDPNKVKRKIEDDPYFLGVFEYDENVESNNS